MDSTNIQPSWPHAWSVRHIYWVTTCDPLVTDILVSDIYLKCSLPTPDKGPPPHLSPVTLSQFQHTISIDKHSILWSFKVVLAEKICFQTLFINSALIHFYKSFTGKPDTVDIAKRFFFMNYPMDLSENLLEHAKSQFVNQKVCWSINYC